MTNNTIKHLGIVENIQGSHLGRQQGQNHRYYRYRGFFLSGGREGDGGRRNVDGHDGSGIGFRTSFRTSYIFIVSFDDVDRE